VHHLCRVEESVFSAVGHVNELIKEDKVNFLLGPYGTSSTLQVSTVAEKNKMPMIEGNGAAESIFSQGYKYTFGVLSPAQNYLRGVVDLALSLDPKPTSVAVLSADDPFSVEVADAAKTYAEQKGLQVVYYQKYPNASTDLRAPLTETKARNPDLFLNSGHLQESIAIMQQSRELGFSPKGMGFSVGPGTPDFESTLKGDANFVMGGTQWSAALKFQGDDLFKTPDAYNTLFKQTFNYEPAYQSADGTACGVAYVKAIEAAGSIDTEKVRDQIAKLSFTSFYGVIKFDERGINAIHGLHIREARQRFEGIRFDGEDARIQRAGLGALARILIQVGQGDELVGAAWGDGATRGGSRVLDLGVEIGDGAVERQTVNRPRLDLELHALDA